MADDDTTTADANPSQQQDSGDSDRIGRVEAKVDRLADMVSRLVPGSHAEAEKRTENRLDRASDVQEQVRAELARAREEEQRNAAADADKSEREQMRADLAKLREAPPQAPTPRRTKLLGWGDR